MPKFSHFFIAVFLFFSATSESKPHATDALLPSEIGQSNLSANALIAQRKTAIKQAIVAAAKVLAKQSTFEAEAQFLGTDLLYAPKSPKAPILLKMFSQENGLRLIFKRKREQADWHEAFLAANNSAILPEFQQKDFTEMQLQFEQIQENIAVYTDDNGENPVRKKYYTFVYHWQPDSQIKVVFEVKDTDVLKNQTFPQNVVDIQIYCEA